MTEFTVLDGPDAKPDEVADFVRLVQQGGAVDENYVRQGIERQGAKIVLAIIDGTVVGVAALKVPLDIYRKGLESEAKSGHLISQNSYPYELGYVAVSQGHEGRGIGKALMDQVLALSEGNGLFATTSDPAMRKSLLPRAGFALVGASWKNKQNEWLQLFTRAASFNA
jgi:GNAT superfamily N-acetyltransferase